MNLYETPYEMTDDGLFLFYFFKIFLLIIIFFIFELSYITYGILLFKCIVDNTFAYPFQVESKFNKQHIISFYLMVHFIFSFHC